MLIFKTLHILSMVTMVSTFIGCEIFYAAAIWRRDDHLLATVHRIVERTGAGIIAILALAAGVVFGLLTAATGGFDYLAGWLIAAYVLIAAFFVNAILIGEKVVTRAKMVIAAEDEGRAVEASGELPPNRGVALIGINALIFAAIIADMVLKPF